MKRSPVADGDIEYRVPPFTIDQEFSSDQAQAFADTVPEHVELKGAMPLGELFQWGKGVAVAVLDTGISQHHVENADLQDAYKGGKDFTNSRSGHWDKNGHGTHCCGIIAADSDGTGTLGMASKCDLWSGKVLGDSGSGSSAGIAAGIDWAVEQGADIISMSLGGGYSQTTHRACQRANAAGTLVIAAAGNSGNGGIGFPGGNNDSVMCCAAIDFNNDIAGFSSRGTANDWSDYGVNVYSTYRDRYARLSGTSMATPNLAATAAAVMGLEIATSGDRKLGVGTDALQAFAEFFKRFTVDLGPSGHDRAYGHGMLNFPLMITTYHSELDRDPDPDPEPDSWKIEINGSGPVSVNQTKAAPFD